MANLNVNKASPTAGKANNADLTWLLSRCASEQGEQLIPAWSGFNSFTNETQLPVATVRYLPFIQASPSDVSTIYTALLQLVAIAEKLRQSHILVTADLAIYSKAQEILWTKPSTLNGKVTMRLGGMHHTMAFVASIGKLFADGGLVSLLTESEATARQMLEGKQIARAVRGIKLVMDAFYRVYFESMGEWFEREGEDAALVNSETKAMLKDLLYAFKSNDQPLATSVCKELNAQLYPVLERIAKYQTVGRTQSATFRYWDNFLDGGQLLLRLPRAERDGDFLLHLDATSESVAWFQAAGRVNYARYTPVYVAEMKQLKTTHPDAYAHLYNGGFVVRKSPHTTFNSVATDQALEQTINKECKSQGGVIGFTLRKAALTRWLITSHR
jgi:hypothetical protein